MDLRNRVKQLLKMCGHAFLSTLHERLDVLERQTRNASFPETQAALLQASIHTVEKLHELTDHVVVETSDYKFNHPEIGLMEFLYSYLPTRQAVVNNGDAREVSESLRAAGYVVQNCPEDAGFIKLGMAPDIGETCAPVVMARFRDKLEPLVGEMKSRAYPWHIVLHRTAGRDKVAFYSNHTRAAQGSWGSVFFFRDYGTFSQAQAWCAAVLPRTYFKPASSKNSTTESMPRE